MRIQDFSIRKKGQIVSLLFMILTILNSLNPHVLLLTNKEDGDDLATLCEVCTLKFLPVKKCNEATSSALVSFVGFLQSMRHLAMFLMLGH